MTEAPLLAVRDVLLEVAHRPDLPVRATWRPAAAPWGVVLFSHGALRYGRHYAPLAQAWASAGVLVLQPSHLDDADAAAPLPPSESWRGRVADMTAAADWVAGGTARATLGLDAAALPLLLAGHSLGAHTVQVLLGARVRGVEDGPALDGGRFGGGVLFAAPGRAADLKPGWRARASFIDLDYSELRRPLLVVAGEDDVSPMAERGWDWRTDPYRGASAAGSALLALAGAGHDLGGLEAREAVEAEPTALQAVLRASGAFLRRLGGDCGAWMRAAAALGALPGVRLHQR